MKEFFDLYASKYRERGWNLEVYHSSITDWTIRVGYKLTSPKHGEDVIFVQDIDRARVFAEAYVALTDWLLNNEQGY